MSAVLYARASTSDQTIQHQEAQARAVGLAINQVVADSGVSGIATRLVERPEARRLFDMLRSGTTFPKIPDILDFIAEHVVPAVPVVSIDFARSRDRPAACHFAGHR